MTQPTVVIDHLRYSKVRSYRRRTHARIRRLVAERPEGLSNWTVLHEHNDSCCRREPWLVTNARLIQALNDDGLPTMGMTLVSA
jgi:hypothetical protein